MTYVATFAIGWIAGLVFQMYVEARLRGSGMGQPGAAPLKDLP